MRELVKLENARVNIEIDLLDALFNKYELIVKRPGVFTFIDHIGGDRNYKDEHTLLQKELPGHGLDEFEDLEDFDSFVIGLKKEDPTVEKVWVVYL